MRLQNKNYKYTLHIAWQHEPVEDYIYIMNYKTSDFLVLNDVSKDIWEAIPRYQQHESIMQCSQRKLCRRFIVTNSKGDQS